MRFVCFLLIDDLYFFCVRHSLFEYFFNRTPLNIFLKVFYYFLLRFLFTCILFFRVITLFAVFVVDFLAPVDEALLSVCCQKVEELPCDSAIERICESHLALIFDLAFVLLALDLIDFPKGIKFAEYLGRDRALRLFARNTQHVVWLFVSHFGYVSKADYLEPNCCFSIKFALIHSILNPLFVSFLKNFAFGHILYKILVIIHVSYHIVEIFLRKWQNCRSFKSNWFLLTRSCKVREKTSLFFGGVIRLTKYKRLRLYLYNSNLFDWFVE